MSRPVLSTFVLATGSLLVAGCGGSHRRALPPIRLYHNPPPVHMSRKKEVLCVGPGNSIALVAPTRKEDERIWRKAQQGKYQFRMPGSITLRRLPNGNLVGSCHFGPPSPTPAGE